MQSNWQTFPIVLDKGLITEEAVVNQGVESPGSATQLVNLFPSLDGGYERVDGWEKFDDTVVPPYGGSVRVQGSGQSGTTLIVSNLSAEPEEDATFTVSGVTGTYIISSVSSYSANTRTATLTLTGSLASSPADNAVVTFTNEGTTRIDGVFVLTSGVVVTKRGMSLYTSVGSGWTERSVPSYGTVLVDGGSQTGSSIDVDGVSTGIPQVGDTFTISGVELVYTISSVGTITAGAVSLGITPSLDSSPADNAVVTFIGAGLKTTPVLEKMRGVSYQFGSNSSTIFVDGLNRPFKLSGTSLTFSWIDDATTDTVGASFVAVVRSTIFYGKEGLLTFSAPANDNDFNTGNGAGSIATADKITSLIPFKDNLIIFSTSRIRILQGNSAANFVLTSLTDRIGCIAPDSVEEIGGDVVYLSSDGIRTLSDTDKSGDFGLTLASSKIRSNVTSFIRDYSTYASVLVRSKNQYILFGYRESDIPRDVMSFGATQFEDGLRWFNLKGFKAFSSHSSFLTTRELVVFSNDTGYVYEAFTGNTFDGEPISWAYESPYISITDTVKRKTIFKANVFIRPEASFSGTFNLTFDFNSSRKIQPTTILFNSDVDGGVAQYGSPSAIYGTSSYGGNPQVQFGIQTVGAGETCSIKISGSNLTAGFIIDTIFLEYSEQGRK